MTTNASRAAALVGAVRAAVDGEHRDVGDVFTDDVKTWTPAWTTSTLDELLEQFARRDTALSDTELDVIALDVNGDHACVEWNVTTTHSGTLSLRDGTEVEATGLRVTLFGVAVAEFDGDRICALRQYWDELSLFEQLGLVTGDD
jgi:ketosteroid isomerase-like protein